MTNVMVAGTVDAAQRTAAKVAGFMLLFLMVAAFFAEIFVPQSVIVDGDAAATAHNILADERLFRISVASDILIFAGDFILAAALFVLLRRVSLGLALLAMLWRAAEGTIMAMNKLNLLVVLLVLNGSDDRRSLSQGQLNELGATYVDAHVAGFYIGLVFLGLGATVFSYLLFKSGYIPKALAAWGVFANLVLATCTLAIIIFPGAEDVAVVAVGRYVPVFFFEVITGGWLLFKGVRAPTATVAPAGASG